jgi:hypothetical protein
MRVQSLFNFVHKSGREFKQDEICEVTDHNALDLINQGLVKPVEGDKDTLLKDIGPLNIQGPAHFIK